MSAALRRSRQLDHSGHAMPIAPYASARATLNGGAIQTGGITAAGTEVVQLSADPAGLAGATQVRWELLDFPTAFALPAGWTLAADGSYFSTAQTPPTFTLLNTANWGKYIVRLKINGGGPALTGRETAAQLTAIAVLTDTTLALSVPSVDGLKDLAYYESSQFGGIKGWVKDFKANLRLLQTLITGAGGGAGIGDHGALTGLADDDHVAYAPLSGIRPWTGNQSFGGFRITSLGTPVSGTDAVTKDYVDGFVGGEPAARAVVAYTGAANTTVLADSARHITTSHPTANTLTIPPASSVAYATAALLYGTNVGAGTMTLTAGAGVTLTGSVAVLQNGWWWAKKTGTNTWQTFVGGVGIGDVVGPASAVLNRIAVLNNVNGKSIADGLMTIAEVIAAGAAAAPQGDIRANGGIPFAANQSMGGFKLTSLGTPTTTTDAATKAYVDSAVSGVGGSVVDFKESVRAATTANITLSAAQTIDGVSVIAGNRVLVKNQTTGSQNGIYVAAAGAWTRSTDADVDAEVTSGMAVVVEEGTTNGGKLFLLTTANPVTVGATTLTFAALSGGVTAGNGLTGSSTLSVLPLDATVTVGVGGVSRPAITGDVTIATGSNVAAIGAGVIVDADVNASAAIALSKLATQAALSVVANGTNATAVPTALAAGTDGHILRRAGTAVAFGTIVTAGIADNAVTLPKLATQAALSVVANGTNATAVPTALAAGTDGHVLRRSGTALAFGTIPITSVTPGTALQQPRTSAGGTMEWFSPPGPVVGTDLTNASVTKNVSDGSQFTLPASTLATSAKTVTLGTTGSPEVGEMIEVIIYSQAQNFVLTNGGPLADILYTVVAGTKRVLHAQWNGTDWRPVGKIRLA